MGERPSADFNPHGVIDEDKKERNLPLLRRLETVASSLPAVASASGISHMLRAIMARRL